MKGAAKCDKHCKLQNSANQQNFERILRFRDMPESMPTSESHRFHVPGHLLSRGLAGGASLCISARFAADALSGLVQLSQGAYRASVQACSLRSSVSSRVIDRNFAQDMKLGQQTR